MLHDDGRPVVLLGQTAGDQADNARLELRVGGDEDRRAGVNHLLGAGAQLAGQALPLAVEFVQQLGLGLRRLAVAGNEQLGGVVGVGQPAGGVDARPQAEADALGRQLLGLEAADGQQRGDARPAHFVEHGQPLGHQLAVLPQQRSQVGHGADGHQIEQVRLVPIGALWHGQSHRLGQLEGDAHPGQHPLRVGGVVALGVDDCHRRRQFAPQAVVVGDDQVQADGAGVGRLDGRADAAVHADDQVNPFAAQRRQGVEVQAIPFVHAVGDVGHNQPALVGHRP